MQFHLIIIITIDNIQNTTREICENHNPHDQKSRWETLTKIMFHLFYLFTNKKVSVIFLKDIYILLAYIKQHIYIQ